MSDVESEYDEAAENALLVRQTLDHLLQDNLSDTLFEPVPVDPIASIPMGERLDKQQLIAKYRSMLDEKCELDHKNELLNRNLLKHFRVKKVFRAYSADNPVMVDELSKKYHDALDRLDEMMASRSQFSMDCDRKVCEIEGVLNSVLAEKDNNVQMLQANVKDIGLRLKSSQTGYYMPVQQLERIISHLDVVRDRVSQVRLSYIETIDKHTEIDQKAKLLEDLGNGLRMEDFEQLRAARQNLTDKIEDRNNELAKLRLRCNADTQILAHVREKEFMLENFIVRQKAELNRCTLEMNMARNDANLQKSRRDELRKTFNDLSQSCGLLDKPDLLIDYDMVTNSIEQNKREIDSLLDSIARTTSKSKIAFDELQILDTIPKVMAGSQSTTSLPPPDRLPWVRNGVQFKRLQPQEKSA